MYRRLREAGLDQHRAGPPRDAHGFGSLAPLLRTPNVPESFISGVRGRSLIAVIGVFIHMHNVDATYCWTEGECREARYVTGTSEPTPQHAGCGIRTEVGYHVQQRRMEDEQQRDGMEGVVQTGIPGR